MDTEYTLQQVDLYNKNYEWIIRESENILNKIDELDNSNSSFKEYETLTKKLIELQNRFKRSQIEYNKLFKEINNYFEDKHGISLTSLTEEEND